MRPRLLAPILRGTGQVVFQDKVDHAMKNPRGWRSTTFDPQLQRVWLDAQPAAELFRVAGDFNRSLEQPGFELFAHDSSAGKIRAQVAG